MQVNGKYGIKHTTRSARALIRDLHYRRDVNSLSREADHVFVHLIENHPQNVGRNKLFSCVAGNLFAYAAKLAFDLEHDGFVCFVAKTELIEHYRKTLGATRIGRSQRMFLDTVAAQKLIRSYYGE